MGLTKENALQVLGLSHGAGESTIRERYKKLAKECHPDRNGNSAEATARFQQISLAYRKLTSREADDDDEDDEDDRMSFQEMVDLFTRVMLYAMNGRSQEYDDEDDDYSSDDDYNGLDYITDIAYGHMRKPSGGDSGAAHTSTRFLSKEEREKNAQELISEEEREKKKAAKRREKKKRRRQKKQQEKQKQKEDEDKTGKKKSKSSSQPKPESSDSEDDDDDDEPTLPTASTSSFTPSLNSHQQPFYMGSGFQLNGYGASSQPHYSNGGVFHNGHTEDEIITQPKKDVGVIGEKPKNFQSSSSSTPQSQGASGTLNGSATTTVQPKPAPSSSSSSQNGETSQLVIEARQNAIQGNKYAEQGNLANAVKYFSKAMQLDPSDYRFFGNRSYCFDKLEQFDRALQDAEKAIQMKPDWPKGYFRKGRALAGLESSKPAGMRDYNEADKAFQQVLKLDKECEDAMLELENVRVLKIMDMGFSRQQAHAAIQEHGTIQDALDSLLRGAWGSDVSMDNDIYVSDEDTAFQAVAPSGRGATEDNAGFATAGAQKKKQPKIVCIEPVKGVSQDPNYDRKLDPHNPDGLKSIWVGNLLPKVSEKDIKKLFSKYGEVTSIRPMPDKFCAFVNFANPEGAGKAMRYLQGAEAEGQNLLIKFPDNPIRTSMTKPIPTTTSQAKPTTNGTPTPQVAAAAAARKPPVQTASQKQRGAVVTTQGNECYFWRTTGCHFNTGCRNKHIPTNKGCDKQPWHKD